MVIKILYWSSVDWHTLCCQNEEENRFSFEWLPWSSQQCSVSQSSDGINSNCFCRIRGLVLTCNFFTVKRLTCILPYLYINPLTSRFSKCSALTLSMQTFPFTFHSYNSFLWTEGGWAILMLSVAYFQDWVSIFSTLDVRAVLNHIVLCQETAHEKLKDKIRAVFYKKHISFTS